jgi:predicted extracellular nuclease
MKPELAPTGFHPVHINADYPVAFENVDNTVYRSSDHDLLLLTFGVPEYVHFLPVLQR